MTDKKKVKGTKKKSRRRTVKSGNAYIKATFNNTIITIADQNGATLVQKSPAHVGFKGSKKSTAFAATKAAIAAGEIANKKYGVNEVKVFIVGPGSGRNAAVKGLDSSGLRITALVDRTSIPHNGCRPRKKPRK
ncbi:30S ribosomal protein S11 [Candidatus Dojkabacteria bacterium]|nr:30S ribosomal protein S11 [Candidatus Dojkabacteria bacterium]